MLFFDFYKMKFANFCFLWRYFCKFLMILILCEIARLRKQRGDYLFLMDYPPVFRRTVYCASFVCHLLCYGIILSGEVKQAYRGIDVSFVALCLIPYKINRIGLAYCIFRISFSDVFNHIYGAGHSVSDRRDV